MAKEGSDGSCLQMHVRSGIRYLWTIADFTKFHAEQYLESDPLYFQNGQQRRTFNLKVIKAKPNLSVDDNDEFFFLHFNFKEKFLEESQYHIRYCLCDRHGKPVAKLENVELQIVYGKVGPFYLNFIAGADLREKIQRYETLIIDVIMLDVTFPSLYDTSPRLQQSVDRLNGNCKDNSQELNLTSKSFHKLFEQDSSSDVILLVKDQKFLVHRIVLVSKSPTFSILMLPMTERNQTLCMTIDDFDPAVVAKMLRYMYFNDVPITDEIVFDLYRIAKTYGLDGLVDLCLDRILKATNVDNAMTVHFFAVKNNVDRLVEFSKSFISQNVDSVMDSGMFKRIIDSYTFQTRGI